MTTRALAGMIRIVATDGPFRGQGLSILLDGHPTTSGGVGGWETMQRPGRRPARWWRGGTELTMQITGWLDVDHGDPSFPVEDRLLRLRQFGVVPGGEEQPAALRLLGDVTDPYSARGGLWVLTGLEVGARLFLRDGRIRRQAVSLELGDFEPVATIAPVSVKRTRTNVAKPRTRTIRTRQGETLRRLAVRELGYAGGWQQIKAWNPKLFGGTRNTGPDDPLRAGLRVVLK